MKNGKIASINTNLKGLFHKWLSITTSFHGLTKQEHALVSLLLYYNHIYKKEVKDDKIRWKLVFDYHTKLKIINETDISNVRLNNLLTSLRRKKYIVDNKLISVFIPELEIDSNIFRVVFNFKIKNE